MQDLENKIIEAIQQDIPFVREPFDMVAEKLGLSISKTLELLQNLKQKHIIRQIAPIYDTKSLGYKSSLVAFKIEEKDLTDAVNILNAHPGVSHNYLRDDEFNVWFTIAIPPDSTLSMENTINILFRRTKAKEYAVLNTKRVFKISARFVENANEKENTDKPKSFEGTLSDKDKLIIKHTQYDLPIVKRPFDEIAKKLNINVDYLLNMLSKYKENGIIRRFSGLLHHRNAGFNANGMSVWEVPEDKIEDYGTLMSSFRAVTHCYERTINEHWKYNLFCMIHGKTKEDVYEVIKCIENDIGTNLSHKILFSSKEFKKVRLRYFEDDYYKWESENSFFV